MVHDKPMVYEHEEVADAIVMRDGLMGFFFYPFESTNTN